MLHDQEEKDEEDEDDKEDREIKEKKKKKKHFVVAQAVYKRKSRTVHKIKCYKKREQSALHNLAKTRRINIVIYITIG